VQTLPPSPTIFHSFAQPIVFFSLDPLSKLISSEALQKVTHLRIQIPSRTIADFLCRFSSPPSHSTSQPSPASPIPLPSLQLLDLSTTQLAPPTLARLLGIYHNLKYLVIDDCGVVPRSMEITGAFAELGRLCVLAGVKHAKEREQALKQVAEAVRQAAAEEAERLAQLAVAAAKISAGQNKNANCGRCNGVPRTGIDSSGSATPTSNKPQNLNDGFNNGNTATASASTSATPTTSSFSRTKKGRKGLATATFSIREKKQATAAPLNPQHISSLLGANNNPSPSSNMASSTAAALEKIRVLPPVPSLHSLCLTAFIPPTDDLQRLAWESEFARGWEEGVSTLRAVYKRLYTSRSNKLVRLYRFASTQDGTMDANVENMESGDKLSGLQVEALRGLVEVDIEKELVDLQTWTAPKLCFGGTIGSNVPHAPDCGHQVSWELAGI
jgi:hypothetical protein